MILESVCDVVEGFTWRVCAGEGSRVTRVPQVTET